MTANTLLRARSHLTALLPSRNILSAIAILIALIILFLILSISYGDYAIAPLDVIKTVLGLSPSNTEAIFIVQTLRLPRAIVALLVGLALGVAGSITQSVLRNPLAAPGIIGINAGAALAAVGLLVAFPAVSLGWLPVVAFGGGLAAFALIYGLAWQGGSSPLRLVLMGIGVSLMATAATNILVTFGNIYAVSQALVWLAGSVYGRSWEDVRSLLPWVAIAVPLALTFVRDLDVLSLDEGVARGIGCPLEWRRGLLLAISVALSGAAVATAGTLGFVGFISPHIARRWVGASHGGLLPVAALTGGLLVVAADFVGRVALSPIELPCGLITSALGAPYFLYLLVRRRQS